MNAWLKNESLSGICEQKKKDLPQKYFLNLQNQKKTFLEK